MPRSTAATVPIASPSGSRTTGCGIVTSSTKLAPSMAGSAWTRSSSCCSLARSSALPEKMPPRMEPCSRRMRVSMRVSMPEMPTTSLPTSSSSRLCSLRQFEATRLASRTA
jgi:hypothetical protein